MATARINGITMACDDWGGGPDVLLLVGDQDAFPTRAGADRMRALAPDAELLWLAQVGHMPNLEAADAFNAAASRLLSRSGAP